jgi:hypothetical protein
MQAADRRVSVPGAAGAVLLEDVGQLRGVVGEVLQRHRAILDERDGLPLLLHRHHDIEARGAKLGDRRLQIGVEHVDHAAPIGAVVAPIEAEISHQLMQALQSPFVFLRLLGELDQQQCGRGAAHKGFERRPEHRDVAGESDHGRVDELDRNRPELDDMLSRRHRLLETAKMASADRTLAKHGRELELDCGGKGERALRADQDMGEVDIVPSRHQRIDVVTADPALHPGKARRDLAGLARAEREQIAGQGLEGRIVGQVGKVRRDRTEMRPGAVSQQCVDGEDVFPRVAIAQRATAAGVVCRHAADGGAGGCRDIDRKPEPMWLELPIQIVEHDAGLDPDATPRHIEIENPVEMHRAVDDDSFIDCLAGL